MSESGSETERDLERLEVTKTLVERGFISRNRDGSIPMNQELASGGLITHLNPDGDYIYDRVQVMLPDGRIECRGEWRRVA